MEILIKELPVEPNKIIMYLRSIDGKNLKAETVDNKRDEMELLEYWQETYDIVKITDERNKNVNYTNIKDDSPLILVFYLYRDLMENKAIITPFAESVNNLLDDRGINAVAFFLPTDDKERIECINPVVLPENEINRINTILDDLKKNFSLDS